MSPTELAMSDFIKVSPVLQKQATKFHFKMKIKSKCLERWPKTLHAVGAPRSKIFFPKPFEQPPCFSSSSFSHMCRRQESVQV